MKTDVFKISVVTCSHNPRPLYISEVIEGLKKQTLDKCYWEYLLIDNASSAKLKDIIDLSWHPNARHLDEPTLGLTHARLKGINEATGDLLIFVDDDNVLHSDFLEKALKIYSEWPMLGAWSGQTHPKFDESPPEWTKRYWGNLVIRSLDNDYWSNLPHLPETMPCGAGLCVRREVATFYSNLHSTGKRKFILDRTGNSLLSAGDNDLSACACDIGLGVGVFKSLNLTHLIPSNRLEEEYLIRLVESISYSTVIFKSFRSSPVSLTRVSLSRRIANLLRLFLMDSRQRRFFRATIRGEYNAYAQISKLISNGFY